jgi:hypothetical protein
MVCQRTFGLGGGYPESESGLAKFPLRWMINEATSHGLLIDKTMFNQSLMEKREQRATLSMLRLIS